MEVIPNILNRKVYDIAAKSSNTAAPQPRQAPAMPGYGRRDICHWIHPLNSSSLFLAVIAISQKITGN